MIQNEVVYRAKFQKEKRELVIIEIITENSSRSTLRKFLITLREIEGEKLVGNGVSYTNGRSILDVKGFKRSDKEWVESSLRMVISEIHE
ncbi:hypothetical protein ACFVS2_20205 [Brevibacillus sp. NPDC058079]|uniref:hypothetical protein n=1 Tax=Brevibacillus sp. NPDC058079 TaxID=3346330 RepID=UPI0036E341DA